MDIRALAFRLMNWLRPNRLIALGDDCYITGRRANELARQSRTGAFTQRNKVLLGIKDSDA